MKNSFLISLRMLLLLTALTGIAYPLLTTIIAKVAFPAQADGSLISVDGKLVGSTLLAERFADSGYFWSRPSAGDDGKIYATVPSSASNLGPTNAKLIDAVRSRIAAFRKENGLAANQQVPADMVFTSASGLDPDISPEAARLQIDRVAKVRHFNAAQKEKLNALVEHSIEPPQFGILGEPRVNVLNLNLAVDSLTAK